MSKIFNINQTGGDYDAKNTSTKRIFRQEATVDMAITT